MMNSLRQANRLFPNCRIANCECNEYESEWKVGCHCMGHFTQMKQAFGDNWTLTDFNESAKRGAPSMEAFQ